MPSIKKHSLDRPPKRQFVVLFRGGERDDAEAEDLQAALTILSRRGWEMGDVVAAFDLRAAKVNLYSRMAAYRVHLEVVPAQRNEP